MRKEMGGWHKGYKKMHRNSIGLQRDVAAREEEDNSRDASLSTHIP